MDKLSKDYSGLAGYLMLRNRILIVITNGLLMNCGIALGNEGRIILVNKCLVKWLDLVSSSGSISQTRLLVS